MTSGEVIVVLLGSCDIGAFVGARCPETKQVVRHSRMSHCHLHYHYQQHHHHNCHLKEYGHHHCQHCHYFHCYFHRYHQHHVPTIMMMKVMSMMALTLIMVMICMFGDDKLGDSDERI